MGINCSFHGFLTADAEQRTSASGGSWARLRAEVGTHRMQGVRITVLGEGVLAALRLKRGDKVRVEGRLSLNKWRGTDGSNRYGLSVVI